MDERKVSQAVDAVHGCDAPAKKPWGMPVCEEIKVADHTAGIVEMLKHGLLHPMAGS